jgi:RimJ/RimL family protein N-acetyltransferase
MDAPGTIRRLWAIERGKLRDHLLRLDPEDRLLRFGGYVSHAQIEGYYDGLDWDRAVIIGYLVDGEIRGVGELKPMLEARFRAAEAALSVERAHQNQGIGTELLRRLTVIARNRSIRSLHMLCLPENGKVLRIARKLGANLTFDQGEVEGRLALPWPNHPCCWSCWTMRAACSPSCSGQNPCPHRRSATQLPDTVTSRAQPPASRQAQSRQPKRLACVHRAWLRAGPRPGATTVR